MPAKAGKFLITLAKKKIITDKAGLKKDLFERDYPYLIILLLYWIILFRNLLTGASWLHDDFPYVYYPGKFLAAISLNNGIIPFWNPYSFAGTPFLGDPQVSIFYPFTYILKFFASSNFLGALPVQNTLVIHFLILSVSCFYLAKELNFSRFSSLLFGLIFTYSSYTIVHMIHMNLIETICWLPLLILLAVKFAKTAKFYYVIAAGIIMGVCVLAGYPQCFVFNYIFTGLVFLYYIVSNYRAGNKALSYKLIAALIIFVFISASISVFQLIPTYIFSENSERQAITYDFASQGSIHPYDLITFLMPKFFGVYNWNETSGEIPYWSVLRNGGHQEGVWMFTVSTFYITLLPLFLIIPGIRYYLSKKDRALPVIGISITALIILAFSFGNHFFVHYLFYAFVPVINKFRNPGHISYLFMLCLTIISVYSLDKLVTDKKLFLKFFSTKYIIICASAAFVIFLSVKMNILSSLFPLTTNPKVFEWVSGQANIFMLFSVLYIGTLYLFASEKITLNFFKIALIILVAADIYTFAFNENDSKVNPESLYTQNSQTLNQLKTESDKEQFRINMREGSNMLFQRYQGAFSRLQFIEGINVLTLNRKYPFGKKESNDQTLDLLNVKYKIQVDEVSKRQSLVVNEGYVPRAKMFYDYKILPDTASMRAYMESSEYDYNKTLVLEKNPDGADLSKVTYDSLKAVNSKAEIKNYGLNEIEVDVNAQDNGLLFMSEVYYPEWEVYVDGVKKEILRADYCLRAVYLEKGSHNVKFVYNSTGFSATWKYSLAVLLASLVMIGFFYYKAGKKDEDKGSTV